MHMKAASVLVAGLAAVEVSALPKTPEWSKPKSWTNPTQQRFRTAELGPRPEFLITDMEESWLKDKLSSCTDTVSRPTRFSIGHRGGACLQFPEETRESVEAGTRMGAGILECDVAFTSDRQLVCRHDQCDLHTTTNIVATDLGAKCTKPFAPAGNGTAASAYCCTSDITLAEFKSLCGKMDGYNASATTPEDFLHGTPAWRTDLYATCGTVLAHKEFLELVDSHGRDFTTELKQPRVPMPFDGNYTQEIYAQQVIEEYQAAGIDPSRVWLQSFSFADIVYWLGADPAFGKQAVLLDQSGDLPGTFPAAVANLSFYREAGVQVVAPPLQYLVTLDENNQYIPSSYATKAKDLGFKILTWSLERSGPLAQAAAADDYYYSTITNGTHRDGDMYKLVDVLARQVGVQGIFSDWSATVTYYANCLNLF
ncbi:glycerophosphoryl diester phosphodiesterase family protein [Rostrohypoxylon terebratum]|nr:glycerophosphoryl diester phosphodiesterase family protein [Rostrohypoxylon terebratum]